MPRWGKGADKAELTKLAKLAERAAKAATDGDTPFGFSASAQACFDKVRVAA